MTLTHSFSQPDLIFVTGMSGAGRSSALKVFEDLGYSAIDNLPLSLAEGLLTKMTADQLPLPMVVGLDFYSSTGMLANIPNLLKEFSKLYTVRLIFLECQNEILYRRYTITRRRHPFGNKTITSSIEQERMHLKELLDHANHIINTTEMSVVMLGRVIKNIFSLRTSPSLEIRFVSFSYRHGLPQDADMVLDARFLTNPHYEPLLQPLTGKDRAVGEFILKDENWQTVFSSMKEMLVKILNGVKKSGRSYLTIAVGCTGGRHRSVFMTQELGFYFKDSGENVTIDHRELGSKE